MEFACSRGINREQPAQWKINIFHFLQVEAVPEAPQALDICLGERRFGGGSELSPLIAGDFHEGGGVHIDGTGLL